MNRTRRLPNARRIAGALVFWAAIVACAGWAVVLGDARAATIATDKDDYTPGERVAIFGSGWEPFETVELLLQEEPDRCADRLLIAVADAGGEVLNDELVLEWHYFHARLLLTATGLASGMEAEATFTDGLLADTIDAAGDSITRGFNAGSCSYGDQLARNWATGDDHVSSFCTSGGDATYSHAERLECAKELDVTILNDGESGATMRGDFQAQATAARANLAARPAPRYIAVLLGHNDACTNTTSKTGNGCGGDQDPDNYCRTTTIAFERELREGLDQLIQVPSARILLSALVRISELCNFGSKSSCGLGLGTSCSFFWQTLTTIFGGSGVCRSLTADCSDTRRVDMYETTVAYNEILGRVAAEYAAIPVGGASATGAVKAGEVVIRFVEAPFHYKFASADISCCDCFHPANSGQAKLAEGTWVGLRCSSSTPCCAPSDDPLVNAKCSSADETSIYPGGFWADNPCGNGLIDPGEECDGGSTNGLPGSCCGGDCRLAGAGTVCRTVAGGCDVAETCDGTSPGCPDDALAAAGTICRPSAGACDVAESCAGGTSACPADAKRSTVCRPASGPCDVAEACDGVTDTCPSDGFAADTVVCRSAAGVCDLREFCTGWDAECPGDAKSTAVCRAAAGPCDVEEICPGTGDACPADVLAASGAVCRGAAGVCDRVETCTGASASCPADAKSTAVCRAAAGPCDVAETCPGTGDACPADMRAASGTVCRGAAGVCDLVETCSGTSVSCPADAKRSSTCRAAAGVCDVAETCDGLGNDCPVDGFRGSSVECRPAANSCDVSERCTGGGALCPTDAFVSAGAECRPAAGVCDVAERCDGTANPCPLDAFAPSSVVCREAAGVCDVVERCTGGGAACPADAAVADGTPCDDGASCTMPDVCVSGVCHGSAEICGDGQVQSGCGEQCDDGNRAAGDGCSPSCQMESTPGCGAVPAEGCRRPVLDGAALLLLRDKTPDTSDALLWRWTRGAVTLKSELGSPTSSTAYQLCIYDGAPSLVSSAGILPGGTCAGRLCWRESVTGFKYANKAATPDGITRIGLRAGSVAGQAKILIKGKGVALDLPTLPIGQPVTVQLRNSEGICWEAVYSSPATRNGAGQFKDRSDQ